MSQYDRRAEGADQFEFSFSTGFQIVAIYVFQQFDPNVLKWQFYPKNHTNRPTAKRFALRFSILMGHGLWWLGILPPDSCL